MTPLQAPGGRLVRRALTIGVTGFAPHPEYGLEGEGPDPLPFAQDRVAALRRVLEHEAFGYECTTLTGTGRSPGPTAAELGAAFHDMLAAAGADDVLIVHVLSHGVPRTTGLYALGSDSGHLPQTAVAGWLAAVEDFPDRPTVLFLLDLCHAGRAARHDWQLRALDGTNRAWVMAAAGGAELAVDGRFTQAVVEVLADIAHKRIQYDRSRQYIDFTWFSDQVRDRVDQLAGHHGGLRQRVTSSALDTAAEPPFLPNPCYDASPLNRVRSDLTAELGGEVGSFLDEIADLAHFQRHAQAGSGFPLLPRDDGAKGLFTGRSTEAARLSDWLADDHASPVYVVTGSPGVGKSALLGVLVCAAHPALRPRTRALWEPLREVRVTVPVAAVHARRRTVREIVGSLAGQLGLGEGGSGADEPQGWTVPRLSDALSRMAGPPPVMVVDALDEMRDPQEAARLLLQPLGAARRPDGSPLCRLLLGTRDEEPFAGLVARARESGDLVDLDQADPVGLEQHLREYIGKLLAAAPPASQAGAGAPAPSAEFADAAAPVLARASGPYLMAALYTSYVLQDDIRPSLTDPATARELGAGVPLTLTALLDLSFARDHAHQLLRPVLAALAFAQGDGMPVETVAAVARAFAADGVAAGPTAVGQLLDDVRPFLRSSPDRDGTRLYRLLHQSVADELRQRPMPGDADGTGDPLVQVYEALVDSLRDVDGHLRWADLHGYLRRHLAQHAVDAGRFDELCTEPEFLVHADPDWLVPELRHARADTARTAASVYRTSAHVHRRTEPGQRRHILSLDAVRHEAATLADRLAEPPAGSGPVMAWRPSWATGSRISDAHAFTLQVPDDRVTALAGTTVDGTPLVVTGARNGKVRVWDTRSGRQLATANPRTGEIHALVCTEVDEEPVLLSAGTGGELRMWRLPDLTELRWPAVGHTETVRTISCADVVRRRMALTCDESGRLMLWDLRGELPGAELDVPHAAQLAELVAQGDGPGHDYAVLTDERGTIRFWSLLGDEEAAVKALHPPRVNALLGLEARGTPQIVTAGDDGHLRMWNARTHELTAASQVPHDGPVYALARVAGHEGTRILSGGSDGTIRSWDPDGEARELTPDNRFIGHMGAVTALADTGPESSVFVSAGADPVLRLWHMPWHRQHPAGRVGHTSWVNALAAVESGHGALLVSAGADGHIRRWRMADGTPRGTPTNTAAGPIHALAATTVGSRPLLVSAGADGHIRRWDLTDGTPYGTALDAGTGAVHALAAAALDTRPVLLSGGADGLIRCWDTESGLQRGLPLAGHAGGVNAVACVEVRDRITGVSCGDDGTLRLWDLETGLPARAPVKAHDGWVTALACAALEERAVAVTGGQDGTVQVWDLGDGSPLTPPLSVTAGVNAVACGAVGGRAVVVAADDCAVHVWDLFSGRPLDSIGVPGTVAALLLTGDQLVLGCEWEVVVLRRTSEGGG
ncbi:AAA family ATPase [Streptomyces sp. enrichment culture]|uniref:AAA family ATPase n=1 Tax=Streptomyces sp. enrichment culture TaxID=1795815 RepID=UPI003F57D058